MKKGANSSQSIVKGDFKYRLVGKDETHICFDKFEKPVHKELIPALQRLKVSALRNGFDLRLASAYRNFEQQLQIWNLKASGARPVLDADENPINIDLCDKDSLVFAILRWSALPGGSRHHWGTDFDVCDGKIIDAGYALKLTVSETKNGGAFSDFYVWLNDELSKNSDFYRPYSEDLGGVAPEPWHLSYGVLARQYEKRMSVEQIKSLIQESDIFLKNEILLNIDEIFHRFIKNQGC